MSLHTDVAEKVTLELLSRVLTLLPSVSQPLAADAITDLVAAQLDRHRGIRYAANNDLGLCVSRLLEACDLAAVRDTAALESHYQTLRVDDPIVAELMTQMADGIARHLTTPLYDLRVALPQEAKAFAAEVVAKLPVETGAGRQAELQHFTWGKLAVDPYRSAAVLFARDRLNCFKRGAPQSHDTDKILRALPFGDTKVVTGATAIRQAFLAALVEAAPDSPHHTLVADLLLDPSRYRRWALTARSALAETQIVPAVVGITNQIDGIEALLQTVSAATLTKLGGDVHVAATGILHNIETVSNNVQLLRAALLYHKETTLADRLLLSPTVVQQCVLDQFVIGGGTEAMVYDYLAYVQLNDHIKLPPNGLSADVIRSMNDRAKATVQEKSTRLREIADARRATALQNTMAHSLDRHHEAMLKQGTHQANHKHDLHRQQRQRALALLPRRPLEEIALEYLVAMREHPQTKPLYAAVNAELLALVRRDTTITKTAISTATCSAITATLLDMLTTRFAAAA